jgi:GrpB-like predicted nucleotidyltransferase (UPF0157 family)
MLLQPYSATWVEHFQAIKSELDKALNGLAYTIEHVGSTAVPNLDSKPIIDIDIIYSAQQAGEIIQVRLERVGYYYAGNQGITDRDVFKRSGESAGGILDTVSHHLYVCLAFSGALERHILFRNHLRKNDRARIRYQQMKHELARQAGQDRKVYAALKERYVNAFIDASIEEEKRTNHYPFRSL